MSQTDAMIASSKTYPAEKVRTWPLTGGVHPPENKRQSLQLPIAEVPLPDTLIFPLSQHIGAPAEAIVSVGDRVLAGQCIAQAKGPISANIHASTSGTVIALEDHPLPHPSGMAGPCILIRPDGKDEWVSLTPCADYTQLERFELLEKIRAAGITGMGGAGFPAAVKLNPRTTTPIDTLIINGTECEPYITADDILMQTQAATVIAGTQLLAHLLGNPQQVIIGVEDNKPEAIRALTDAARSATGTGAPIQVVSFPTKYPSGGEKQLIQILTGKEVPSGQLPASIGIVVQNVGSTVAVWEAITLGKPLVERITTVVGEALQTQRNVRVRLGTPIEHILKLHGFDQRQAQRLIMGGPMMGFALLDQNVPVVKSTNCILAPSRAEIPDPEPAHACIRCGLCAEACPASLLPQQLYWYARAEDFDRLQAHNLMDCIECGACSYVCPSNIPLVQYYRASKGAIRQQATDKEKADRSRRRFEFRQERIAREEAEKEAKRQARKLAAEAAKQKLQSAPVAAAAPVAVTPQDDLVAAAMARVQAKQLTPDEQKAKLERALLSAQNRLQVAQQKLADAETDDQRDKCAARIKEAELKLQDAEAKLASFTPETVDTGTPATTAPAVDANDPVAAAIARAQAKMALPADEKLKANLESLQQRLTKAEEKLAAARAEGAATVDALQAGADKLRSKIADTEAELAALPAVVPAPAAPAAAEQDAATAAIERAKAKAAAQATMSAADKLRDQVDSLHKRLDKARQRLQLAEESGDENIEAFRSGVTKLEAKLAETQQQLEADA